MGFKKLLENFKRNFCNYQEYEKEITNNLFKINLLENQSKEKDNKINSIYQKYDEACNDVESLAQDIKELELGLTPVDLYCQAKRYKINNFVYKDKIIINGVKIPCNMREMITPSSYVVEKVRKSITTTDKFLEGGLFLWYQRVMYKVHSLVEWTTDGRDDNYYYPAYTLTTKRGDCDDMAFAQCSIEPELGNAFGFWDRGDGKPIGHAFAVGIVLDELWIFDAVANNSLKYGENCPYSVNYIITKNNIYVLDDSIRFGDILFG